jgi:hypothetical protein
MHGLTDMAGMSDGGVAELSSALQLSAKISRWKWSLNLPPMFPT